MYIMCKIHCVVNLLVYWYFPAYYFSRFLLCVCVFFYILGIQVLMWDCLYTNALFFLKAWVLFGGYVSGIWSHQCCKWLRGDSMLRTLHSDTKINILNPNLDVKMFIKGVQTYLESIFSVPFVPNKKMLWLALKTLKVWAEESVLRTLQFKQPLFKVTFFKEIFLWIFNLEQKIIVPSKHNNN